MIDIATDALVHSLLEELERCGDGLHGFMLRDGTVTAGALPDTRPQPLLACGSDTATLSKVLACFSSWDGEVRITALQDEGLCDIWISC